MGIEKQCVCFVVEAEVLVLHRLIWEIKTLLEDGVSRHLSSIGKTLFFSMFTNQATKETDCKFVTEKLNILIFFCKSV